MAEQPFAAAVELPDDLLAVAQHEEQSDEGEEEDDAAVEQVLADDPRMLDEHRALELAEFVVARLGRGEMLAPPFRDFAGERQVRDEDRLGYAVGARLGDPVDGAAGLAPRLDRQHRQRGEDEHGDGERRDGRDRDLAAFRPARLGPIVERRDGDGDHHRPHDRRQEARPDPQPEQDEEDGEDHLGETLLAIPAGHVATHGAASGPAGGG